MKEGCSRLRTCALLGTIAAALSILPLSFAGVKTTGPSTSATVLVVINDKGISVFAFTDALRAGSTVTDAIRGPVPRGDILHFKVINHGKKVHDFTAFGRKTPNLKPGQMAHFTVPAVARGSFPYKSTLDGGKTFRGFLAIY